MSQTSRGQHMLKVVIENLRFLSLCAICWCCSVSVVSDSLRPHGLQHARSPHPLPSLRACSNSCPLSRWCHSTVLSSDIPFPSCLQSFPASVQFSSVQSLSGVQLFVTPWTAARQASLSITNSRSLVKLMSVESVIPSNHLILCRPLLGEEQDTVMKTIQ